VRLTVGRAGPASAVPLSAGFFSELVLRDDLARPGPVVEISSRPWPSGSPEVSARRPAPRRFPRPGHGGVVPTGPGVRRRQARRSVPAARALSGRDAAGLPGIRSPGTVTTARSAASSIRSRRSIFLAHVQDQRRELGCVARLDPGAECGQAAHERAAPAHGRPRGHLGDTQAPKREQAPVRAGRPGGICECPVGPARHSCGTGVLELAHCPGDGSAGHRQLAVYDGRQALGAVSPLGACTRPGH